MHLYASIAVLLFNLFSYPMFAEPSKEGYETLHRDRLPTIRSRGFGMQDGPADSEIFEYPLFCLRCEGEYCDSNYVDGLGSIYKPTTARYRKQKNPKEWSSNPSTDKLSILPENNNFSIFSVARRFESFWVGRQAQAVAICPDGNFADQIGHVHDQYRFGCKRLPDNLRADPGDTRRVTVKGTFRLFRFVTERLAAYQYREAECDDGYYIWGMACVDGSCDYFELVCIRVFIRTASDEEEQMTETDSRVCNDRVCCPLICQSCGGSGCTGREGGRRNCCESDIRLFAPVCTSPDIAPCVISPDDVISTPIEAPFLQHCNGRVCCAESCEQCGGDGCESFNGGADNCCTPNIQDNGKICRIREDFPCVMD